MVVTISGGTSGNAGNPLGKVTPLTLEVTDSVTTLTSENTPNMPWIVMSAFNDGPDAVWMTINEDAIIKQAPLRAGEPLSVDMERRNINKVLMLCDVGGEASIRIQAKS